MESVSATDSSPDVTALDEGLAPVDGARGDGGLQGGDQDGVGNVVAEGIKADLVRVEGDLRRADEALCAVDDAHGAEWRRLTGNVVPDADAFEQRHGAGKQRRGAFVGRRPGRGDQRHRIAGIAQDQRGGETDRSRADDGNGCLAILCRLRSCSRCISRRHHRSRQ